MAKSKIAFFCSSCGYESPKWLGKCPACSSWNTFIEELIDKGPKHFEVTMPESTKKKNSTPRILKDIETNSQPRIVTFDKEFNRVLGGGIVPGSLILIGGEPGVGKSTLLLQIALNLKNKVLYISGEESEQQIKLRAERIPHVEENQCYVLSETNTQTIFGQASKLEPDILIIDSIQTLFSSHIDSTPGSISQIRECTGELMKYAKESNTPVILIGHITKDGQIAGPKLLEHMVDTVLQFEGDRHLSYRVVRTIKNRFGSTSELGIYEMLSNGLREVSNPSELLINQRDEKASGVSIAAGQEGNRPLMIEIQALVSAATYGNPQRTSTGYDNKRLSMLLAVLEKRTGFRLSQQDVFLNIAGGLKIDDPAIDLAVCMAIVSSFEEIALDDRCAFAGEIGLGGEIRTVNHIENRIKEAEKLGFKAIYISKYHKIKSSDYKGIKVILKSRLVDVIDDLVQS